MLALDYTRNVVIKNTSRVRTLVHHEICGSLYGGDRLIVGSLQKAVFLKDHQITACYEPGEYEWVENDTRPHEGKLYFVDMDCREERKWHFCFEEAAGAGRVDLYGTIAYGVDDAVSLVKAMASREILEPTALNASKRFVQYILQKRLACACACVTSCYGTWSSLSEEQIAEALHTQLDMLFTVYGLKLHLLGLEKVSCICADDPVEEALEFDEDIDSLLTKQENEAEWSNFAGTWTNSSDWQNSGWSNTSSGQTNSGCCNASSSQTNSGCSNASSGQTNSGWSNYSDSWLNSGWNNYSYSWRNSDWNNYSSGWANSGWSNYASWSNGGWSNGCDKGFSPQTEEPEKESPVAEATFKAGTGKVERGEFFALQVVMFAEAYRERAEKVLAAADAERQETESGIHDVALSSLIRIRVFSPDIPIEDDLCEQKWNGKLCVFQYLLTVPPDYDKKTLRLNCRVYTDDVVLTDLKMVLKVGEPASEVKLNSQKVRTAFASYSSLDRAIVAARLQGMFAATNDELDIFFDVESLRRGEDWEQRIRAEIQKRSIFYLFWSRNARKSEWVNKELAFAVESKQLEDIEPIPLEKPHCVPTTPCSEQHTFF